MKVTTKKEKTQEITNKLLALKPITITEDIDVVCTNTELKRTSIYNIINGMQQTYNDIVLKELKKAIKKRLDKSYRILSEI